MQKIRVFLVDDHAVFRHGLRLMIDAHVDMCVVGESSSGRDVCNAVARSGADLVLIDVSMPDGDGVRATEDIRRGDSGVKVLALTRHTESGYVQQMLQAGAKGYALKQTDSEMLFDAIRTVARGGMYLDPAVAGAVMDAYAARSSRAQQTAHSLTSREQQIAAMVAQGYTNKEIAATLGITVKTVEGHKTKIMQKLGITSRAGLVRFAMLQGWLDASSA